MISKVVEILPHFKVKGVLGVSLNKCAFKVTKIDDRSDAILKLFIISKNMKLIKIVKILK